MESQPFTCVTCNVAFREAEKQRTHYKTDWHRYNLKRKIADLPPVNAQAFAERVQLQKSQVDDANKEALTEVYCKICCKHFTTRNSFLNHIQSKKHKELEARSTTESTATEAALPSTRHATELAKAKEMLEKEKALLKTSKINEEQMEEGNEADWEDIAENENIEIDESNGIDLKTCLFCEHKSSSIETKCEHMAQEHSFFIPDAEYVSDLDGLLKFLGVKIGCYHVCLWCSSKCYPTLKAVQQHMTDKGHTKMKFEGDALYEIADFYTYNANEEDYADDSNSDASDEEAVDEVDRFVEDENYELCLPSGAKIGHRSLFRYYKQNFGHRNLELKQYRNNALKDKYKALGFNNSATHAEIQTKRKDLAVFQRWKSKMHSHLGEKANKLMVHYRRQNIIFG